MFNAKSFTAFIFGIMLSSSWWIFLSFPTLGSGDRTFGPLILLPIITTFILVTYVVMLVKDNWNNE